LLVVIAIIAILLAILMPALKRVKEAGKRIQCLNNTKTLALSMLLYLPEYDNRFPKAWTNPDGWVLEVVGHRTNGWQASKELQQDAIRGGLLYPYVENVDVYRCPIADKNEYRTYSIPHSMNGFANDGGTNGGKILKKITQVTSTDSRILFLDDYVYDWDACWMIFFQSAKWWNSTPIRHGSGGNVFSFADGHADFHIWKDKRTVDYGERCHEQKSAGLAMSPEPDNEDIIWAQRAVWGTLGYTPGP